MNSEKNKRDLLQLLLKGTDVQIKSQIEDIHPADLLDIVHEQEEHTAFQILNRLPDWMIAAIIDEEDDEEKFEMLTRFSENKQKEILKEMSSDEITDLVGVLDEEDTKDIFEKMSDEDAENVRQLLSYAPDTAGGIMATEFITIQENKSVKETLKYLQTVAEDAETTYYLYVVDAHNILKGVVSLSDMVFTPFDTSILAIANTNVTSVLYNMDQEDVANLFEKYGFLSIPVVDEDNHILGIVTVDDIVTVIKEESTEDIHRLAGIDKEEKVDGTLKESIKSRLPWLLINLITAILASAVVGAFEGTISQVVTLATFMPIVAGMGGNAGTQSLTVIVRGIALGELTYDNAKRIFFKELGVGLFTGVAIGVVIAVLGVIWEQNVIFGVVIGFAMVLNMVVATTTGFIVPIILKKFRIDPALASSVFVTTATDVLGFFFFLGLATVFLQYLI